MSLPTSRKRSSRACDGCKQRRMKCEDIMPSATTGEPTCKLCREAGQDCTFETPVRKRGPAPGFRRQQAGGGSPNKGSSDEDTEDAEGPQRQSSDGRQHASGSSRSGAETSARPPSPRAGAPARRRRPPLLGLPPTLVDELLAVYFTHVHNVWPLIYKPLFNPHTASSPLLLSMLAIAACVAHPGAKDGLDSDKLFAMAETALHHCRNESRIDILQALMVLSLRQTGCGDKRSAFAYAGRASCMALNLGLHLAPPPGCDHQDAELRSRVYWNAYVLDKILAEETGRTHLLPYRRANTPMPSINEADEFEPWPPQTASSAPVPRSVRHVPPRRGYVMSFFVWTCRLAMIVEDILNLEYVGPPVQDLWDRQFVARLAPEREIVGRAEDIGKCLDEWRRQMPKHLEVDLNAFPLPHHVVGLAWYDCIRILLYSRFIKRKPSQGIPAELAERAHRICSQASETCVDYLALLDRHKLLQQVSSDIIHLLAIITLFEAFDATSVDESLAHRAKVNFAQCCIWLRDFSSSWPAASAHKVFFEGLIQGGLKLSSGEFGDSPSGNDNRSPGSAMEAESPSIPEGLRNTARNLAPDLGTPRGRLLSMTSSTPGSAPPAPAPALPGNTPGPSLFQLPQFYWNQIQTATVGDTATSMPDGRWDWDVDASTSAVGGTGHTPDLVSPQIWPEPQSANGGQSNGAEHKLQPASNGGIDFMPPWSGGGAPPPFLSPGTAGVSGQGQVDQAAMYAALMSYMVEAAKTN